MTDILLVVGLVVAATYCYRLLKEWCYLRSLIDEKHRLLMSRPFTSVGHGPLGLPDTLENCEQAKLQRKMQEKAYAALKREFIRENKTKEEGL